MASLGPSGVLFIISHISMLSAQFSDGSDPSVACSKTIFHHAYHNKRVKVINICLIKRSAKPLLHKYNIAIVITVKLPNTELSLHHNKEKFGFSSAQQKEMDHRVR